LIYFSISNFRRFFASSPPSAALRSKSGGWLCVEPPEAIPGAVKRSPKCISCAQECLESGNC
jgi:hypothetical protein